MRSTADHQFISTDVDELDALLCAGYEQLLAHPCAPAARNGCSSRGLRTR